MSKGHHMLPVWFFIGVLLTVYGVIILITSILQFSHPATVEFAQYHAGIWGGILLLVIGGCYTLKFWPRRSSEREK